eukprot:TRINITY_DN2071_c0_g1_i7.p2 TRINITY_DN2071_c0_g1~~TRINITY_DN2071_c0_g1_i7.p2  ORF type:complete len:347 (-),score=23.48 TRINITY_DN2071_c0_g1_i7:1145-2185(-)
MVVVLNAIISIVWNLLVLLVLLYIFNPKLHIRKRIIMATNTKVNVMLEESSNYFVWESIDRCHLYQSPIFSLNGILVLRVLMFIYFWVTILDDEFGTGDGLGPPFTWLKFYTNWTFITYGAYSFIGSIICMQRRRQLQEQHEEDEETQSTLPTTTLTNNYDETGQLLSEKVFVILGAITFPCSLFLTIFYWTLLYDGQFSFNDFMYHGLYAIFLLVDLLLVRRPVITSHIIFTVLYSAVYLLFMWIYAVLTEEWIYGVLDWNDFTGVILQMILPFLICAAYMLTYFFTVLYSAVYLLFMWIYAVLTEEWIYGVLDWNDFTGVILQMILPFLICAAYMLTYFFCMGP